MAKAVIIDDEPQVLDLMTRLCTQMGHETHPFTSGVRAMKSYDTLKPDLVIVDLRVGDADGLDIIRETHTRFPDAAIIMVTGYGSVETAVEAMRLGAFDYLTKPFELSDLKTAIARGLDSGHMQAPAAAMLDRESALNQVCAQAMIGQSDAVQQILKLVNKVADYDSPILIEGEFGSGEQRLARAVHNSSRRKTAPFKALQCSSLPENLLDRELFSPDGDQSTIFQRAHGGTVFLEEINVLPLRLQSTLFSFLDERQTLQLAGNTAVSGDFRLITSSNERLEELVEQGKFRKDLYYKISIIPVSMPPLRKRKEDVPVLVEHFLRNYADLSGANPKSVDKYGMELLSSYSWPGNAAELQNAIERACALAEGGVIKPADLPGKVTQKVEVSDDEDGDIRHTLPIGTPLSDYTRKQERLFISETLKYNQGSREKTASMLDVSIATLYRKMGLKIKREKVLSA